MLSAQNGHDQCVLLENGAAVDAATSYGWTSLILACCKGEEQCARALLKAGASLEARTATGKTALALAEERGRFTLAEWHNRASCARLLRCHVRLARITFYRS